jgi:hypothetical protein
LMCTCIRDLTVKAVQVNTHTKDTLYIFIHVLGESMT